MYAPNPITEARRALASLEESRNEYIATTSKGKTQKFEKSRTGLINAIKFAGDKGKVEYTSKDGKTEVISEEVLEEARIPQVETALRELANFKLIPDVKGTAAEKEADALIKELGKLPRKFALPAKFHKRYFDFVID